MYVTQRVNPNLQLNYASASEVDSLFNEEQQDTSAEIKAIATKLALNEMKLNKWDGSEKEWEQVYKIVWLEKRMFVELTYNVQEILNISRDLLRGQQKMIAFMGVIISNQGQILQNQEVIITNQGLILDVTGQILDLSQEILITNYEILGTVKDIQGDVKDMKANGIKVRFNDYSGMPGLSKYIGIVAGILGTIILLVIVLRIIRKKK